MLSPEIDWSQKKSPEQDFIVVFLRESRYICINQFTLSNNEQLSRRAPGICIVTQYKQCSCISLLPLSLSLRTKQRLRRSKEPYWQSGTQLIVIQVHTNSHNGSRSHHDHIQMLLQF